MPQGFFIFAPIVHSLAAEHPAAVGQMATSPEKALTHEIKSKNNQSPNMQATSLRINTIFYVNAQLLNGKQTT